MAEAVSTRPAFRNLVLLTGRLLLAWIFVHEGVFLVVNFGAASATMAKAGIPAFALILTIVLQLSAGIAIAVGWQTRLGAAALGLFAWRPPCCFTPTSPSATNFCISRRTLRYQAGCGS